MKDNQILTCEDRQKVKEILSIQIINQIDDKSIQNIVRGIIFNPDNIINWSDVLKQINKEMPEIKIMKEV